MGQNPKFLLLRFICGENTRRDEFLHHYKNIHGDIHSHLNGWLEQRCPYAAYGCTWTQTRLHPNSGQDMVIHDNNSGVFTCRKFLKKSEKLTQKFLNLASLPDFLLQKIFIHLDSYSLKQLVRVNQRFKFLIQDKILKFRGVVVRDWEKINKFELVEDEVEEEALLEAYQREMIAAEQVTEITQPIKFSDPKKTNKQQVKNVWRRTSPKWHFSNCPSKMENWLISDDAFKLNDHLKNSCEFSQSARQNFFQTYGTTPVPLCSMAGLEITDDEASENGEDSFSEICVTEQFELGQDHNSLLVYGDAESSGPGEW